MIFASDFRNGVTFEMSGEPCVVLEFQFVKPGKGATFVRTRYKNLFSGAIKEEVFNPNDTFPEVHVETRKMQYLFNDGENYCFMDMETYEELPLKWDAVENAIKYLRENDYATVKLYKGKAFLVEPPMFVDLKVVETDSGIKGDLASSVTKAATVETGAIIQVPIFIGVGERIRIDTRTGQYLGRSF